MSKTKIRRLVDELKALSEEDLQEVIATIGLDKIVKDERGYFMELADGSSFRIPNHKIEEHIEMRGESTRIFEMMNPKCQQALPLDEKYFQKIKNAFEPLKKSCLQQLWRNEFGVDIKFGECETNEEPICIAKELKKWYVPQERIDSVIEDIRKKYPSFAKVSHVISSQEDFERTFYIHFKGIEQPYSFSIIEPEFTHTIRG